MEAPLCGHRKEDLRPEGYRVRCGACGSFWDAEACSASFRYSDDYPAQRNHFDPKVGENKVRTLREWLAANRIDLSALTVCEVGFGAGYCLGYLHEAARAALGIEAVPANLKNAAAMGVPESRLFHAERLPASLPENEKVDLWIFQDSFEHLPDPSGFLAWMSANSSASAKALLVLPRARSLSERLMGRRWIHKLDDHSWHWSREGLVGFFEARGFQVAGEFYPWKRINLNTVLSHAFLKAGRRSPAWFARLPTLGVPFNFGELGILFEKAGGGP